MDQFILHQEQTKESPLLLGTIVAYDTTKGVRIQLDGEETAGVKYYKSRKGLITAVGDRVVLAPISGSYVVLGTVGLPARKYNMNQCPTGSNATAANCASWINTLIEALTAQGLMSKNGW